ncbi:MAG: copper amine oxidase N-terminal domain-containing protein [Syntrophomonas sp.]
MKGFKILLMAMLLLSFAVVPVDAAGSVRFLAKNIYLYVDGKAVNFPDQQPYVDSNERIMVPVRFPAQTLGAKVGYDFSDPENREVYIQREANGKLPAVDIIIKIGDEKVKINNKTRLMDTVAVAANGRTMVPVRFVSEYLGAEVRWNDASKAAHIFSQGQSKQEQDEIIIDTAKSLSIKKPVAPESPQQPSAPTFKPTVSKDK